MWLEVCAHNGFKENSALAAAQRNSPMHLPALVFSLMLGVVLKSYSVLFGLVSIQPDWFPDLADCISRQECWLKTGVGHRRGVPKK